MTPKEKAEELVNKYMNIGQVKMSDYSRIYLPTAKLCALIAVDEIIRLDIFDCNCEWSDEDGDTREYWDEVKKEISNL